MPETDKPSQPRYFFDHLMEFRKVIVRALAAITIGVGIAFWKSELLFILLLKPFQTALAQFPDAPVKGLQTLIPVDAFMINMKLATFAGIVLASPFILRDLWFFARPALKSHERGAVLLVFSLGLFFFLGGVCFSYFVIIPLALKFLLHYNLDYHFIPQWTLQGYYSFAVNFILIFGLVFELPLVLAALVSIGVATPAFLIQKRKHAILGIFILAAILAPSADPVTQTLVAVPLVVLYEVGIWLSYLAVWRKKKNP